jgi:hypothetical protein
MPEAVLCPGFFAGRHWTYSERLVTVAVESRFWAERAFAPCDLGRSGSVGWPRISVSNFEG